MNSGKLLHKKSAEFGVDVLFSRFTPSPILDNGDRSIAVAKVKGRKANIRKLEEWSKPFSKSAWDFYI